MQAVLNNISEKDQSNETMIIKKIIKDYSFYSNKLNYDYYGNCVYETNNYKAVKSLNKKDHEDSDDDSYDDSDDEYNKPTPDTFGKPFNIPKVKGIPKLKGIPQT